MADADADRPALDVRTTTIGLSPQYWSYTPLLIGDLNDLLLLGGVDCMVVRSSGGQTKVLPVQNVLIFGVATSIVKRATHTTISVDDGTGVVDVACWDDDSDDSPQGNAFDLPPLLPEHQRLKRRKCGFRVGDSLEVMGKIKTLTAGEPASQPGLGAARCNCTREVVVKSICISTTDRWNAEALRWLTAMQFAKQADSIGTGGDVLSLCGDRIKSSVVLDGDMLVDRDFVVNRRCCQTSRRTRLAFYYCHCEAKLESLDPTLFFRGALIDLLLEMESRESGVGCVSATEDCLDLIGLSESDQTTTPPLLFRYETVNKNEELSKIALDLVVSQNSTPDDLVETNVQRLFRRTFAALVSNGLLCLFNQEEDIYLLVSRSRVVEPYLRWRKKQPDGTPHPFFIGCIPRKRLLAISKHLDEE